MANPKTEGTEPSYHFFVSSALHWHAGADLTKLLQDQKKADFPRGQSTGLRAKACNVFLVPLPPSADYEINFYRPMVPGTLWLFSLRHDGGDVDELPPWVEDAIESEKERIAEATK